MEGVPPAPVPSAPVVAAAAGAGPRAASRVRLVRAQSTQQLHTFAALTREYYEWLGEDLSFQGIEEELASLPGCYAPPRGCIIIAYAAGSGGGGEPLGCVAVRPLVKDEGGNGGGGGSKGGAPAAPPPAPACEGKRLWVRGAARGTGTGAALVAAAVAAARELGYRCMVLDTLERLGAANRIYESLGFRRRGAYYHNPLPDASYWEIDLRAPPAGCRTPPTQPPTASRL